MIILDTNIISELMKPSPSLDVMTWLDEQPPRGLFITTITIAEISYGLFALPDGSRRMSLEEAFNKTMIEAVSSSSIKAESLSDRVPTINALDLSHLLQTDAPLQLIDVREVHERAICHIGGELVPLGELESSLHRFAKNKTTVVYCRSGGRSDYACRLLIDAGFLEVKNLSGGILAWIDAVDPSLIRY